MVVTLKGELILIDAEANVYRELGRAAALKDEDGGYSHPAFVGTRVYLRGSASVIGLELGG